MTARGKTTPTSTAGSFAAGSGQTSRVEIPAAEQASPSVTLPDTWPLEPAELEAMIGWSGARELTAASSHGQVEAWRSIRRIAAHGTDKAWIDDVAGAITDSARVSNWRGNWEATHAVASFAYVDADRRGRFAGRDARCERHSVYSRAFRKAMHEQGHSTQIAECTCNTTEGGD